MEGILPYPDTLQHLYDNLGETMFQQRDYFEHINPTDRIKLLFYIWSIKLTKDFAVGEDLLNRISFAHLFYTEGSKYIETCDECAGNGYERCDVCDGTGKLSELDDFRIHRCKGIKSSYESFRIRTKKRRNKKNDCRC